MRNTAAVAFVALASLFCATPASAAPHFGSFEYITQMDQENDESPPIPGLLIQVDGAVANDSCPGTPGQYFLPDESYTTSNTKYKTDLALVMAAYMNQRPIAFYVQGCYTLLNAPIIGVVRVQ